MRFCDILRALRKENNYTAKQLSSLIGYSVNIIYDWEKGRCEPPYNVLIKLSNIFGVSIDYLLGIEDDLGIKGYEPAKERISAAEPLSGEEEDLLKDFRKLGVFARSSILIQVRALAEKAEKEEQKQK